jgi:hypothetical protein
VGVGRVDGVRGVIRVDRHVEVRRGFALETLVTKPMTTGAFYRVLASKDKVIRGQALEISLQHGVTFAPKEYCRPMGR